MADSVMYLLTMFAVHAPSEDQAVALYLIMIAVGINCHVLALMLQVASRLWQRPLITSNYHLSDAGVAWPSLHCFEKGLLVEDVKVSIHEVSAYRQMPIPHCR